MKTGLSNRCLSLTSAQSTLLCRSRMYCSSSSLAFNNQDSKSLQSTNLCCQVNSHWYIFSSGFKCSTWSMHLFSQGVQFNSETQSHATLINPLRSNTFPLVQNETFICEQKHQKKKKNVQLPQRHTGFI